MPLVDTGYRIRHDGVVMAGLDPTEFRVDHEGRLLRAGQPTRWYVEDGHFFMTRRSPWTLWIVEVASPTGHRFDERGRLLGERPAPPWDG